jgi:RNA polymerase sigma-70 factor (ECF subfamily)
VHRKFADYDRTKPIRPWLFAFAFRSASNYSRLARHRREVSDTSLSEPPAATTTPEQELSDRQRQDLVLAALEAVPLERRSVLVMHDIDGFSAPEIAESLSIPINTVYSRIRVARDEFKSSLRRERLRRGEA